MPKKKNDDAISKAMAELGRRSGKKLTANQRSERARKAARARWDKRNRMDV